MTGGFQTSLDLYQYGAATFYAGYGILCWFFFKWYCREVYFRGNYPASPKWKGAVGGSKRWTDFHDTDGPTDYMIRGAGQCCLVMAYSVLFVGEYIVAIRDIVNGADAASFVHIGDNFLSVQIATWCLWTTVETYYTWKQVEWGVIGPVHIGLCLLVLAFSVVAKVEYQMWAASVV